MTTNSNHSLPITSNILNRDFYALSPNENHTELRDIIFYELKMSKKTDIFKRYKHYIKSY